MPNITFNANTARNSAVLALPHDAHITVTDIDTGATTTDLTITGAESLIISGAVDTDKAVGTDTATLTAHADADTTTEKRFDADSKLCATIWTNMYDLRSTDVRRAVTYAIAHNLSVQLLITDRSDPYIGKLHHSEDGTEVDYMLVDKNRGNITLHLDNADLDDPSFYSLIIYSDGNMRRREYGRTNHNDYMSISLEEMNRRISNTFFDV